MLQSSIVYNAGVGSTLMPKLLPLSRGRLDVRLALFLAIVVAGAIAGFVTGSGEDTATRLVLEKWPRLSEQHAPIFKWTAGGLQTVQSCPRRRSALATNRPTRWATRGAPAISSYAAMAKAGRWAK